MNLKQNLSNIVLVIIFTPLIAFTCFSYFCGIEYVRTNIPDTLVAGIVATVGLLAIVIDIALLTWVVIKTITHKSNTVETAPQKEI